MDSSTDILLLKPWICLRWFNCLILNFSCSQRTYRGTPRRFPPKCIENTAIQSTFKSLEMRFKRRYEIYICSVILGKLKSFRNYQWFSIIFPKILDAI